MTFFALELVNLISDKPDFHNILNYGSFSIDRTGKKICRTGAAMAFELTINAEEKSRLKGIRAFADVSTAVNRWTVIGSTVTYCK